MFWHEEKARQCFSRFREPERRREVSQTEEFEIISD